TIPRPSIGQLPSAPDQQVRQSARQSVRSIVIKGNAPILGHVENALSPRQRWFSSLSKERIRGRKTERQKARQPVDEVAADLGSGAVWPGAVRPRLRQRQRRSSRAAGLLRF